LGFAQWLRTSRACALFLAATLLAGSSAVVLPLSAQALVHRIAQASVTAPAVYAISPNRGPKGGGTAVTIYGAGFTSATAVTFGTVGTNCGGVGQFNAVSDTEISAISPGGALGAVDVVVAGPGGSSPTGAQDRFTYVNSTVAVVGGISPNSGSTDGSTMVTISGTGFTTATRVMFGATATYTFPSSDTSMEVFSPPGVAGTVDVTVVNAAGTSATSIADRFTFTTPGIPVVRAVAPNSGTAAGRTGVTIVGTGFAAASAVHFGTTLVSAGAFSVGDESHIFVTTPPGSAATMVDVTVTTPAGTSVATNASKFSYLAPSAPVVKAVIENRGPAGGGTTVNLVGSGFTGATAVKFGANSGTAISVGDDGRLSVTSPPGAVGTVDISITTPVGTSATGTADHFTYFATPAPVIYGIGPSSGITSGQNSVEIFGSGFTGLTGVFFGTTVVTSSPGLIFDTQISVTAPARAAGPVDVTVTTPGGTSATSAGDRYTYLAPGPPTVDAVSPNSGTGGGGDYVQLFGSGFTGATAVHFGTVAASGITATSDTEFTVFVPSGTPGLVDVTVTTPLGTSGTSPADHFTYVTPPTPVVTAVSPASGFSSGGTLVFITGTGLTGVSNISFGTAGVLNPLELSDNLIEVLQSPSGTGLVDVTVTTAGGTSATTSADHFTYTASPPPAITAVSPSSGPTSGGSTVYISGSGFAGASTVNFGTAGAVFKVNDDHLISATSPAGSVGQVDITVVAAAGTSPITVNDHFTYTSSSPPPAPSVTAVSPSSGSAAGGSTTVYVTGVNFSGATAVDFGPNSATFSVADDNLIFVTGMPLGSAGIVDVTVVTPSGTSAITPSDHYAYVAAVAPTITNVSPGTGPVGGGTIVWITGTNFDGASAVSFGGTPAGFNIVSSTLMNATSPAGAGTVNITITAPGGTSPTSASDTFVFGGPPPSGLQVNGIAPNQGSAAGGTAVVILGMGFSGVTAVMFGTTPATNIFVASDTDISVVSPSRAAGTIDVTVIVGAGTSATSNSDRFTFTAPVAPVISALEPNHGSSGGSTGVNIFGSGFSGATTILFGGNPAQSTSTITDSQTFAISPAGTAGTSVAVQVVTSAGTSAMGNADRFTYDVAGLPVVSAVDPGSGTSLGGDGLSIYGSGFSGATIVRFGSNYVFPIFVGDTQLIVTSPAGPVGNVDVTVVTPGGTSATSNADKFTYVAPGVPVVNGVSPNLGGNTGGRTVRVFGTGFAGATGVSFGTAAAAIVSVLSDGEIDVVSPPSVVGTVHITVVTPTGVNAVGPADQYTYFVAPAPAITAVSPNSGAAGTQVFITGTGLSDATSALFGTVCTFVSTFIGSGDTLLEVFAPPGPSGTVDVTVTSPDGTSATNVNDHFTYTAAPLPVVTYVAPANGPSGGGTEVFITGSGLSGVTGVSFGSTQVTQFGGGGFGAVDDNLIDVTSPAGSAGPPVDIRVTTPGGTSAVTTADQYTYTPTPVPSVTVVVPNSGPTGGGQAVFVTGTGFTNATQVNFGATVLTPCFFFGPLTPSGAGAAPAALSPNRLGSVQSPTTIRLPIHYPASSSRKSAPSFTTAQVPTAAHRLPVGLAQQSIPTSHRGPLNGFGGGPQPCTSGFEALSDNSIELLSPPGALGTVDITVTGAGGTSATSVADHYTYVATPAPVVSSVSPGAGPSSGGTLVFVTGTSLRNASAVRFGTATASVQTDPFFSFNNSIADSLIEVLSPPGAVTSNVDVTVTTAGGTSVLSNADKFGYGPSPTPSVTVVSPATGPIGTTVSITGTGFLGATQVDFGGAVTTASAMSDNLIQATSPSNGPGVVDVRVVTAGGTSPTSAADHFTYTASPTPVVSAVGPASGSPGSVVYITGSGLNVAGSVTFGAASAAFVVLSDTLVQATSPAGSGTVDVRVTTPGGTSATSAADNYTFGAALPAVAVFPAMANGAYGGYVTAATIQNIGTAAASVHIAYYDQNGAPVGLGDSITNLSVNASWTVRQDNGNSFPSSGGDAARAGSAVVYSNQPVAAFVNEFAPGNVGDATSYSGVQVASGVGTTLYAPTIVNNAYGGYTTGIGLLNEGSSATNVTITYRDGGGALIKTQSVPALAAHAYQALYSGDTTLALPSGFAGTATITSSAGQPLGAVVNEVGPGGQFSSFDAVPAGSTTLYAPAALDNAFGGYNTGMGIVNTTGTTGTVTITYFDAGGAATATIHPIAGNGSLGVYQGTDIATAGPYTAKISSTVAVAAIVNEVAPSSTSAKQSTSYNTFSAGSAALHLPLVENAGSDPWNTGEGIMNTGTAGTTVTVNYYNTATGASIGTTQTLTLAPNAFWGLYQPTGGLPGGTRATAVITTSSGGQVAAICNESSATTFMSYDGQ
jgi:hypothetical protein